MRVPNVQTSPNRICSSLQAVCALAGHCGVLRRSQNGRRQFVPLTSRQRSAFTRLCDRGFRNGDRGRVMVLPDAKAKCDTVDSDVQLRLRSADIYRLVLFAVDANIVLDAGRHLPVSGSQRLHQRDQYCFCIEHKTWQGRQ